MLTARKTVHGSMLPSEVAVHPVGHDRLPPEVEKEMIRLHQSIETLLPNRQCRIIQFISPEGGEGTSAIVKAFGNVVSRRVGKAVVSIDIADLEKHGPVARDASVLCLLEYRKKQASLREGQQLAVGIGRRSGADQVPQADRSDPGILFQRDSLSDCWAGLSAAADMILLDTPSASISAAGLAVAPTADGVVLVIEADRTGQAAARRAVQDIERSGGHVLGVVLNKKRRYLPRFLERWV